MPRSLRRAAWLLPALLAACAPVQRRGDHALLAAQSAREAALAARPDFSLTAKLGVSDGHDGGSGSLRWSERGGRRDFVLRAPITGRSFHLVSDADGARLEGLDGGTRYGVDAASLLRDALGWHVPMAELDAWVRGMRAPGTPATLTFNTAGLPAVLVQDGWRVEYRDWFDDVKPAMPRKVYASRGSYRVRLAIRSWSLP